MAQAKAEVLAEAELVAEAESGRQAMSQVAYLSPSTSLSMFRRAQGEESGSTRKLL